MYQKKRKNAIFIILKEWFVTKHSKTHKHEHTSKNKTAVYEGKKYQVRLTRYLELMGEKEKGEDTRKVILFNGKLTDFFFLK